MSYPFESDEFGQVGGYAGGYQRDWLTEEEEAIDAEFLNGAGFGDEFPEEDEAEWCSLPEWTEEDEAEYRRLWPEEFREDAGL